MKVWGPTRLVSDVQESGLCIGCGACVDLCPYFRSHRGKTVQVFACTLERGLCFAACPKAEVDLDELAQACWGRPYEAAPLGPVRMVKAARAGAALGPGAFQGGGTVSALIVQALRDGQIDAAVLTGGEPCRPQPRVVSTEQGVLACAGTKFGAAPTLAALNRAAAEGRRRLAVAGTPCQAVAAAQMRLNPLQRQGFEDPVAFVVGLFCTWSFDQRPFADFLVRRANGGRVLGMDILPPPNRLLSVRLESGALEIPLDAVRPFVQQGCRVCPDLTAEWADASVGMYEARPGWNTLIVRTARAEQLVENAVAGGVLETEDMAADCLEGLRRADAAKKERAFRAARESGLLVTDGSGRWAALRVAADVVDRILK
jgi:coenzyme F420 hydrogenase subunit beta